MFHLIAHRPACVLILIIFPLTLLTLGRFSILAAAPTAPHHSAAASLATAKLVSTGIGGAPANHHSWTSDSSADGRVIAFRSRATNLVPGDTTAGFFDIFIRDRQTGQTERVSRSTGGQPANGESESPAISSDGLVIAFSSLASNLVGGDTNERPDIFVHDRKTGQTTRVSVSSTGAQTLLAGSGQPDISDDGRYVVFESDAGNLVPGDTNASRDVFWHDRVSGATRRLSVSSAGVEGNSVSILPSISGDGQVVAFASPSFSLVSGDANGVQDIFVRDRTTGETTRVSVSSTGEEANGPSTNPALSGNGRFVVFESMASNLVNGDANGRSDIFRHDRQTGETIRISTHSSGAEGNGDSAFPSVSRTGLYVAFESAATNLVDSDLNGSTRDIFVKHVDLGQVQLVTLDAAGGGSNGTSFWAQIAAGGDWVTFSSDASDLVSGDSNGRTDVFVTAVEGPPPTWTVLFYMAADGARGSEYNAILNRLEAAADSEAVQILAYIDRPQVGDGRLYVIQPDYNLSALAAYVENVSIFSLGELDLSDPARLQSFIETGVGLSPTPSYGLVLDGYGHGTSGGFCDGSCANVMTQAEIAGALAAAEGSTGRSLDMIMGFANGLGSLEAVHALEGRAAYVVASPYDMTAWPAVYGELTASIGYSATASEAAVGMAGAYAAAGQTADAPYTIAVYDMTEMPGAAAAAHELGAVIQDALPAISPTLQSQVVSQSQRYDPALVDLAHLATLIQGAYPANTDLITASQAVIDSLAAAVIYESHGSSSEVDLASSQGLGIFLPQAQALFYEDGEVPFAVGGWSTAPGPGRTWGDFLAAYVSEYHAAAPFMAWPPPTPKISPYQNKNFLPIIIR